MQQRNWTDEQLAQAWQRGLPGADAEAFRRFAPQLQRYAARRSCDADAPDIVQDTFLRAALRIGQLRQPGHLRAWLYAIARNLAHDANARRELPREIDDTMLPPPAGDPVAAATMDAAQRTCIDQVLGLLRERDRRIIGLQIGHDAGGRDVAEALDVEPALAYVLIGRARTRLDRVLRAVELLDADTGACSQLATIRDATRGRDARVRAARRHLSACSSCAQTVRRARRRGDTLVAAAG